MNEVLLSDGTLTTTTTIERLDETKLFFAKTGGSKQVYKLQKMPDGMWIWCSVLSSFYQWGGVWAEPTNAVKAILKAKSKVMILSPDEAAVLTPASLSRMLE